MRHRNLLLCVVSVVVLGMAMSLQAAPLITLSMRLADSDGTTVDPSTLQLGVTYQVFVGAQLTGGFTTDTNRNAGNNLKPLGIQNLVLDLQTPGTVGRLVPVGNGDGPPQTWAGYADLTPDGIGAPFNNLLDRDGDTDDDVAGGGFNSTVTSLATNATGLVLSRVQYGVDATNGAFTAPMEIFVGQYLAATDGPALLRTVALSGNVFQDSAANTTSLLATPVDIQSGFVDAQINANVIGIPEPASMGLLALVAFGLLGSRRRA